MKILKIYNIEYTFIYCAKFSKQYLTNTEISIDYNDCYPSIDSVKSFIELCFEQFDIDVNNPGIIKITEKFEITF